MANPEHLALLYQGIHSWNAWRKTPSSTKIDLSNTDLSRVGLSRADLSRADLSNADLSRADLSNADLSNADLSYTDLTEADLRNADLSWAELACGNLGKADLTGANLSRAELLCGNLGNAELSGANLVGADLGEADLSEANLSKTNLRYADLTGANLKGVNLFGANLEHANVSGVNLSHANLNAAFLGFTMLGDVDLRLVNGLKSITHVGPSTIGIDTIFRSKGEIPEIFLRGAGVPDTFITYAKSLVGSAIEFYSCFISYSTKDQEFAHRLYADLGAKGVRCWFAPHDVQGGRKLHEQLDEAIRFHDKLLLILSPQSMKSEWVKTEISKARNREVRDGVRVLFPITLVPFEAIRDWECFDSKTGKDSASEILEYFIPDFSSWKDHDGYKEAFERLVKDLKARSDKSSKTSSST